MIEGTLAAVSDQLPNGFHDAEVDSLTVEFRKQQLRIRGVVWIAEDGPAEVYRPFELIVSGLETLSYPDVPAIRATDAEVVAQLEQPITIDGVAGWPPDRVPENPPFPEVAPYSFYVSDWNDFFTCQAHWAVLRWLGPAYDRSQAQDSARGRRTKG